MSSGIQESVMSPRVQVTSFLITYKLFLLLKIQPLNNVTLILTILDASYYNEIWGLFRWLYWRFKKQYKNTVFIWRDKLWCFSLSPLSLFPPPTSSLCLSLSLPRSLYSEKQTIVWPKTLNYLHNNIKTDAHDHNTHDKSTYFFRYN